METVFFDHGTETIKYGTGRKKFSVFKMPSLVGSCIEDESGAEGAKSDTAEKAYYIGNDACQRHASLDLVWPISKSLIRDWEVMERIWHHIFETQLGVEPSDSSLIIAQPAGSPRVYREKCAEVLFETFKVPTLLLYPTASLSLLGRGRTTGLVFDSGHGATHITPVYESAPIADASTRLDLGGKKLNEFLTNIFAERGVALPQAASPAFFRQLKAERCAFSLDYDRAMKERRQSRDVETFSLPDGTVVGFTDEFMRCAEMMFHPTKITGEPGLGVHEAVSVAIKKIDAPLRKLFYGNIFFTGGNSELRQLGQRLLAEMSTFLPPREEARIIKNSSNRHLPFQGAMILRELEGFSERAVSKEEYYDSGPSVLFKKIY